MNKSYSHVSSYKYAYLFSNYIIVRHIWLSPHWVLKFSVAICDLNFGVEIITSR